MTKRILKLLGGLSGLLIILVGIIYFRTTQIKPPTTGQNKSAELPITVDANSVASHLAQAVRFKTVTQQNRADTDWEVFLQFQDWLKQTYPAFYNTVNSEQIDSYAQLNIWTGSDLSLDPIVFLAHQDVVPASETDEGWDYPPFSGEIADGFVYGRGSIDDKGSLIALLEAADRLANSGFKPKRTLIFAFGHDEEVAGSGANAIAHILKDRNIKPYAVIDEGGAITTGMSDVKGPVARIGVAEKGYLTLVLTAKAEGGHSSTPPDYTAIGALAKAIAAVEAHPFKSGMDDVTIGMLKATASEQNFMGRMAIANLWLFKGQVEKTMRKSAVGSAMLGTTIAPTIIEGGFKENALPREAKAYINFRLHSRDSIESVVEHVKSAINDERIDISYSKNISAEPSPVSQIGTGPWLWIEKAINRGFPGTLIAPNTVLGGTDSRFFALVTDEIYRFAPYVFDATDIRRIHGLNERMNIEAFAKAVAVYYILLESAGNPQ
ncbi:MAG TPA: M20/M25/M40 family metallo-hydrolase [Hellea balneolensis]|uniref:M20/M25/M40 family metallo-hydrolase n=1 Tax=Hellea balneolensis TaxID=287478 RepID=A0A7C5R8C7_9PROT|nr:M20/M25/M40 family metallo-hydrolase [Hellea balneolensis]